MPDAALALPTRQQLIRKLDAYARPSTAHGLALCVLDVGLYAASIAGVLFLQALWAKIACAVFAGMMLGRMFSLAHNAAHENIVVSRKLNRLLAFVLFTPFLYNYRLWRYEHHALHHPFTNDTKPDAYKPYSKAEFDALPRWRRLLERFYRAPTIIGWGVYYLLERHASTKLYPPSYVPDRLRPAAWLNALWLLVYAVLLLGLLVAAPRYAVNLGPAEAIALGFVLPLLVFEVHDGFALYFQHTDPRIPWFKGEVDRDGEGRTELLSVHMIVPRPMAWFYHHTFSHPVHHLHPRIPCYRVYEAQVALDRLLGPAAIVSTLSLRWLLETTRRCKLYDWDNRQWLDFDGRPTGGTGTSPPATPEVRAGRTGA